MDEAPRAREPARRLFLALWPQEAERTALADAALEAVTAGGGRPVPTRNLHVTLTFLGSVPERHIQDVGAVARRVAQAFPRSAAPLLLTFDHIEYWKKSQVLCALAGGGSAQVHALAEALTTEAAGAGFSPDPKTLELAGDLTIVEFQPHVTLARKVRRRIPQMPIPALTWSFKEFALIQSQTLPTGSVYTVLERYPLN
jgi:RNA 2',3'-cyclic 3'-phosphodiesterase